MWENRDELERAARAAARCTYVGSNRVLCNVLGRYKMLVPADDASVAQHLMFDGFWESWVTLAVSKMLMPGMGVLNLGANFGYYSVLMADLVGTGGHVIAVEPQAELVALLQRNLVLTGMLDRVTVIRCVCSNVAGVAQLVVPDGMLGCAAIKGMREIPAKLEQSVSEVWAKTAAQIWTGNRGLERPDVVFMDIEGAEPFVWDDILALKPSYAIIVEYDAEHLDEPQAFAARLSAAGTLGYVGVDGAVRPCSAQELYEQSFAMAVVRT